MKILAMPRYEPLGASSRLRFHQYVPYLTSQGIDVEVRPLFSDGYVRNLQDQKRAVIDIASAYFYRIGALIDRNDFDLLWIEKEVFPWLPSTFDLAALGSKKPFVIDYDDAVFHSYDQSRNKFTRKLLERKHPSLIHRAALVVTGNNYLTDFARRSNAKEVAQIPTVIDLDRYPRAQPDWSPASPIPTVGWIGQRATVSLLLPLVELTRKMSAARQAEFKAVGIDASALNLPMNSEPWTEETEVASIQKFDIGIMPLVDEPFERGKCGYKLIQYMACGLPVVASPVGANRQIVEHGVNGFLADTPEEWEEALRMLIADPKLRSSMGAAGRKKVEESYSLQVTAPKLVGLLERAATSPTRGHR